ncbi:MAG: hypothetical protein ACI9VS_000750 [Candidatus Binatia bacterium]|jgi:hypothetical protein
MTNMRIYGSVILGLLLAVGSYDAIGAERDFAPRVVIPRAFAAITNAPVLSADKASERIVRPNELVLGVVVEGKARAYPINMLTGPRREIINDELGGKAIAATW